MSDQLPPLINPFPSATESDWKTRVETVLKGADFEKKLVARTADGIAVQPLYERRQKSALVGGATSGSPWQVMARVDHPDSSAAAKLALDDLEGGADSLCLVPDSSYSARGFGLSFDSTTKLDQALEGVRLELVKIRLEPSAAGILHAQTLAALVEHRKLAPQQMDIDFGIDPIGALLRHGGAEWQWPMMVENLGETVSQLTQQGFKGPFLTVDLRPSHEAGASDGQELGVGLAQAIVYLRALESQGIPLHQAASAISFIVPVDADQFSGITKLRALRKLWTQIETACGLKPRPLRVHAETSWRMLTKRDPHVNILRATVATFAAGIGGADSVTVLPFTSALGLPDAAARRLARNTSIVLQEESNLWRVADPAAGAGGFEALTEELCAKAWGIFQEIEREGGILQSLGKGALQARISVTAKVRAKAFATRKDAITGTSEFANLIEVAPDILDVKPRPTSKQASSTFETLIQALPVIRSSEVFETLRDRADAVLKANGTRPEVALVTIGPLADHAARLAFTRNAFEVGGFAVNVVASDTAIKSQAKLFCLVGSDAAYASDGIDVASALRSKNRHLWLAGRPGEMETALRDAGVNNFVFSGSDIVEILTEAMNVSNP